MIEVDAQRTSASVVIPMRNAEDVICDQLESLRRTHDDRIAEIIVVDSRSEDGSAEAVTEFAADWPMVNLVRATRPGANVARNAGVAACSSDVVLLCDADDVVAEGWASKLLDALGSSDVVRGRYELELLNDPPTIAARGSVASTVSPPSDGPLEGLGGNCGFRRSVWVELGGLNEAHYGSDDIEFFWRAQQAGFTVQYVADAIVHYRLRPSYADLYRQQRTWAESRALILRDFGPDGPISPRPISAALRQWVWLARHCPDAASRNPERRGRWVRSAAGAVGRFKGSLRHRVWYL